MPNYTNRERRRLVRPYALVLEPLAEVPPEERARTRVLDFPAGRGCMSWTLRSAGFDVTPCDLFPERFVQGYAPLLGLTAREAFARATRAPASPALAGKLWGGADPPVPPGMECLTGDLEARFPFEDGRFDFVVSVEGIEHVSDRQGTLAEYRRVTRKGGRLILTTPNMLSLRARLAFALCGFRSLNSWLDEYSGVQGRSDDGKRVYHGHAFLVDYNEMRYSLHQAGFRLTRVLPMHESRSSHLLKWVMLPWVWAATRRACFLGKRKFERYRKEGRVPTDAPNPAAGIYGDLMSSALLYGRVMGLEAEAV